MERGKLGRGLKDRVASMATRDSTRMLADVLVRPSIGPIAGWLLTGVIALVTFLTLEYAPGAARRALLPHGADETGIIPVVAGYWTLGVVSALAVVAGWEPVVRRMIDPKLAVRWSAWLNESDWWVRGGAAVFSYIVQGVYHAPSIALSLADYLLARPVAILAGVKLRPVWLRYAQFLALMLLAVAASIFATAPWGFVGAGAGIVAIVAIVRRWAWVERDRETFFVARATDREEMRIGFAEDLRDEALTAIVFMFALIPLGLRQIDLAYDAFDLIDPTTGAATLGVPSALEWVGFFGAELTKSVPFVDWSEVFHVANGSPIRPKTVLGAQTVFALRAMLDLLLLAAVLQAVQISARLAEQNVAFLAGRLPILDPFAERSHFRPIGLGFSPYPHVNLVDQPAVAEFPSYEPKRLAEIVAGANPRRASEPVLGDLPARRAALAVLARQNRGEETASTLRQRVMEDRDLELRQDALRILVESFSALATEPLIELLSESQRRRGTTPLRVASARALGWMRATSASETLMSRLSDGNEAIELRVHAGLALAKINDMRAKPELEAIARRVHEEADDRMLAMALSYALAKLGVAQGGTVEPQSVAGCFHATLRSFALRGARSAIGEQDVTVPIPSGSFTMGSPDSEEGANDDERPQRPVKVAAFEIGKYQTTFEEFDVFCNATGFREPYDEGRGRGRYPVVNVAWVDAHRYCDWLNDWTGERFRLPSEAEWEYACRAGTTTPWSIDGGEPELGQYAWFDQEGEGHPTHPVGLKLPNAFGIHDMHGNVREWCQDAWHSDYQGAPASGIAWLVGGDSSLRVVRGGWATNYSSDIRSAARSFDGGDRWTDDGLRLYFNGFRLARSISASHG